MLSWPPTSLGNFSRMDAKMTDYPVAPDAWFNQRIRDGGGIFDRPSFDLMMEAVTSFRCAVDVGAHVGSWTIPMTERFDKVFAFEPFEKNFKYLERNAGHIQNLTICSSALGASSGEAGMREGGENSGQSHIDFNGGGQKTIISALDDFEIRDVGLLKIDAEGFELPVLIGATQTIKAYFPAILVELNGLASRYGSTDSAVREYILGLGYRFYGWNNKDFIFVKA